MGIWSSNHMRSRRGCIACIISEETLPRAPFPAESAERRPADAREPRDGLPPDTGDASGDAARSAPA